MLNSFIRAEYMRQRKLGNPAKWALHHARARDAFTDLENAGLARLETKPDDCPDLSYLEQNCFADVRDAEYDRANRDGVWGLVAEVFDPETGDWQEVDSVWGFTGDDWRDSGYDADMMRACIDWHDERMTRVARDMELSRPDMYPS